MEESIPLDRQSYWGLVWRQFKQNRLAFWSLVLILGLFWLAAWAPLLADGKPFLWTTLALDDSGKEALTTTYPLWQYLVAPTDSWSVDYLFNYFFFLTLSIALTIPLVVWMIRKGGRTPKATNRSVTIGLFIAVVLAILPFISPGFHKRATTPEERKENPEIKLVEEVHLFRRWYNDPLDYVQERTDLDSEKGAWALFPFIPHDPLTPTREILFPPGTTHWFGTDREGRDVLTRMIHGARISMSVGFVSVSIAVFIGIIIGGIAGYFRGWVDMAISRFIELVLCFPAFFLILTIIAFIEDRSIFHVMLIIGLTSWPGVARLVRGEFLKLVNQDFVSAARALGCSSSRIMFRHLLPNALGPVLVSAAFGVAGAILTESALSYLGFGAPPPTPTWGEMISQGKIHIDEAWWLLLIPGLAIFLTVTVYNLAGDGLRDAMDPRLRQ